MIIRNEIPILEFDTEKTAVIEPSHEQLNIRLPKKAVFAFLNEALYDFLVKHNAKVVEHFISMTKEYPVYVLAYEGQELCFVQAPVGAAPATQILDWLIGYGVEEIVSVGSCGTLVEMPENYFLVPTKALRDEGTSYHYAAPSRFMDINEKAVEAIKRTLTKKG